MKKRRTIKWALYAVIVLLTVVLQNTPGALPKLWGVCPILVIPCVTVIAAFEDVTAGAAFAVLGGLLWDLGNGITFGFNALFLMVLCVFISLLVRNLFRNTIVTALFFCLCSSLLIGVSKWFFFVYIAGRGLVSPLLLLPRQAAYTLPFAAVYYFIFRWLHGRFADRSIAMD